MSCIQHVHNVWPASGGGAHLGVQTTVPGGGGGGKGAWLWLWVSVIVSDLELVRWRFEQLGVYAFIKLRAYAGMHSPTHIIQPLYQAQSFTLCCAPGCASCGAQFKPHAKNCYPHTPPAALRLPTSHPTHPPPTPPTTSRRRM